MAERVNATGQLFGHLHSQAWEFFRMGNLEKATELAQRMLPEPRVGDFHRAGFHLIMAFSDDQYVDHAERALALYSLLTPNPHVEKLKNRAQDILKDARADFPVEERSTGEPAEDEAGEAGQAGQAGEGGDEAGVPAQGRRMGVAGDGEGKAEDAEEVVEIYVAKIIADAQAVYDDEKEEIGKEIALAGLGEDQDKIMTGSPEEGDEDWNPPVALEGVDLGPGSDPDEDISDGAGMEQFLASEDEDIPDSDQ